MSDVKDVGELLTLAVTARRVAYQRTDDPVHLCQLLAAVERVLAREDLPTTLSAEATDFREEARTGLAARSDAPCTRAPAEQEPPAQEPRTQPDLPPMSSSPSPQVQPHAPSHARGLTIAGSVLLGTAALAAIAVIPVQVRRVGAYNDLEALIADVEQAGTRTPEQAERMNDLGAVGTWTRSAKIGLVVSAGVLAAVGAGVLARGKLPSTSARARLTPYGGPQGAGLTLVGRF